MMPKASGRRLDDSDLVTIIINNCNYGRFLSQAIRSALSQTDPQVETIVVDDGSTDDSAEVILSFGEAVDFCFKPNGGQASALNAGFSMSRGRIIIFLDSDDMLDPDCVSRVREEWEAGISKAQFGLRVLNSSGVLVQPSYSGSPVDAGDLRFKLLSTGVISSMPMSGNAFCRDFLTTVMPMPEIGWERGADVYLFNLAALYAPVITLAQTLGSYRRHGQNDSLSIKGGAIDISHIKRFLQREVLLDAAIRAYAKTLGMPYNIDRAAKSLSHVQQELICALLDRSSLRARIRPALELASKYAIELLRCDLPSWKKPIFFAWLVAILISPGKVKESFVILSYKVGLVLAVPKEVAYVTAAVT